MRAYEPISQSQGRVVHSASASTRRALRAIPPGLKLRDRRTAPDAWYGALARDLLGPIESLLPTVIAYQLVQVIRTRLRQAGENASRTTLRRILEGQQRITATFRRADGRTVHVCKATRAEPPQQAIYDALGIGSTPGGTRKTVV